MSRGYIPFSVFILTCVQSKGYMLTDSASTQGPVSPPQVAVLTGSVTAVVVVVVIGVIVTTILLRRRRDNSG